MAPRKFKARPLSITAIPRSTWWPWSELPPNLVQLPYNVSYALQTSTPGTSKSWVTTRRCTATEKHQWPQLHHLHDDSSKISSTSSSYPDNHFLGDNTSISDVVRQRPNASYWCIMKVDTASTIPPSSTLPSNHIIFNAVAGLMQLRHVHLAGIPSTTFIVDYTIYLGGNRYTYVSIRHECTTVDPFDSKKEYMEFTSVVQCEGKFFALSLQGTLAVLMLDVDSRLKITAISTSRAVPSVSSKFFKEYLVEMNGEILLVFLIHQKSLKIVDQVEVFCLGLVELDWIKVGKLQGKTLFLNKCCIWANSAEIGCRGNCIYFKQGSDNSWWIYDRESCCISPA